MKLLDRLLLALVTWRLSLCRRQGDNADRFGDSLIALLSGEIARRNAELGQWQRAVNAREQAEAERMLRAAAEAKFKESSESGNNGLRLQ